MRTYARAWDTVHCCARLSRVPASVNCKHLKLVSRAGLRDIACLGPNDCCSHLWALKCHDGVPTEAIWEINIPQVKAWGWILFLDTFSAALMVGESEGPTSEMLSFLMRRKSSNQSVTHTLDTIVSSPAAEVLPPVGAPAFMHAEMCAPRCEGHILNDRNATRAVW